MNGISDLTGGGNGNALEITGISKSFGKTKALDAVTFTVPTGSIFGLLGPNGAGKTTLFSIIASFLNRDTGTIKVLDTDVDHVSDLQGRMSILPQDALFQRNVPIMEQLIFFRLLDGVDRETSEAEVRETMEKVGLGAYLKRGVQALSHGMLKRMGIAQAFLGSPEVILLDEPTSGLDPQNAKQIRDLIVQLQQTGQATTMISSHNMLEIQELCDHVAILDKGKVVTAGAVSDITRQSLQVEMTLSRALDDGEMAVITALPGTGSLEQRGPERYRLALDGGDNAAQTDATVNRLLRAILDMNITPRQFQEGNSLEEFFLKVTGTTDE